MIINRVSQIYQLIDTIKTTPYTLDGVELTLRLDRTDYEILVKDINEDYGMTTLSFGAYNKQARIITSTIDSIFIDGIKVNISIKKL